MSATLLMAKGTVVASWDLNKSMLANVLRSAMSFFDMTPLGRIVNRFSKDLDTIDTLLPMNLRTYIQIFFIVIISALLAIISKIIFKFNDHEPEDQFFYLYLGPFPLMEGGQQQDRLMYSLLSSYPHLRPKRLRTLLPTRVKEGSKETMSGTEPCSICWFTSVPS